MKRLHVSVSVDDLETGVAFYSALFGQEPTVQRRDYAKWMVDDPRVNFAIGTRRDRKAGLDHLGIQAESKAELAEVYGRLKAAEGPVYEEGATTCCYARSEKSWIRDPAGVAWEAFLTHGTTDDFGVDADFDEQFEAPAAH